MANPHLNEDSACLFRQLERLQASNMLFLCGKDSSPHLYSIANLPPSKNAVLSKARERWSWVSIHVEQDLLIYDASLLV